MILAGDIGGTKTNLALFLTKDKKLEIQEKHQFVSQDFTSLEDVIQEFLNITNTKKISKACFGIAGPVIHGECHTTNLPWDVSSAKLQTLLSTQEVILLNDLEATAYGMLHLKEEEFISLNPNGREVEGNRAVIAAGTGLGEAMLFYDGKKYHPIGSEGGHCDFASTSEEQDKLLQWMRKRYHSHVSFERILSGPGIYTLYEFLLDNDFAPQPTTMIQLKSTQDKSAMISNLALEEKNPLCIKTLELFCEIYAAEAGNLALKSMALGGVYIGGGIAPKILPFMTNGDFLSHFVNKGRFEELLRGMQVKISLNDETALLGAAYFIMN